MEVKNNNIRIINNDCLKVLEKMDDNSLDLILTDPPYFIDKLDDNWNAKQLKDEKQNSHITFLPKGMKYDKKQTKNLYDFYLKLSKIAIQKLKPGGYFLSFSSPRLIHAITMAKDISGFEIRDMINWVYLKSFCKAMSITKQIKKVENDNERERLLKKYENFKTPMLKSCFEPICVAMKPRDGTFFNNELNFETGLLNFSHKTGENKVPANLITTEEINDSYDKNFMVKKPNKKERGDYNFHISVKPVNLMEQLVNLFSKEGSLVLDPFLGSGTTGIACKNLNRKFIGVELNKEYFDICLKRLEMTTDTVEDNAIEEIITENICQYTFKRGKNKNNKCGKQNCKNKRHNK